MEFFQTLEVTPAGRRQSTRALRVGKLAGSVITRAMYQAARNGVEVDNWNVHTYVGDDGRVVAVATGFDADGDIICSLKGDMDTPS